MPTGYARRGGLKAWLERELWDWDFSADIHSSLAVNIRWLADRRDLTIKMLANESGISERALYSILGMRASPRLDTVAVIAYILDTTPSDLLKYHAEFRRVIDAEGRRRR